MSLPELFIAATGTLTWGRELDAKLYPAVIGILQERLDLWFVETRGLEETIKILKADAVSYKNGSLPPIDDEDE